MNNYQLYHLAGCYLDYRIVPHPLFNVITQVYRWYSECTYETPTERLLELLADFQRMRPEVEASFIASPEIFQKYLLTAHIIWRTYHQLQAKPMLEAVIQHDPAQAESYFFLGQIYQDQLKDPHQAIACFRKFIELEPNLIPENNYFIDGWFINTHAYQPSTIEALINLGDISRDYYQDHQQAKEYYQRAIVLNPHHHLAPYTRWAELLIIDEENFNGAFKAYKKAYKNYLQTSWQGYPYDRPCEYYPELESWAKEKYPFTYRYYQSGIRLFADKFEELGDRCYQRNGDGDFALKSIGMCQRIIKQHKLPINTALMLKQIELVLNHYRDYWQAESLCRKVLARESDNQRAKELLLLIKERLG